MKKKSFVVFCSTVFFFFAGCSATLKLRTSLNHSAFDIPMNGRIPSRDFSNSSTFPLPLAVDWEYDASAGFGSGSPIVVGDAILFGTLKGELHGVNINTGKRIGYIKNFSPISSSPAAYKNLIIYGLESTEENLVAFNTEEDRVEWTRNVGGVAASPLIIGDRLIVGGLDGWIYSFDPVDGSKKWSYDLASPVRSSPCASDDLVFCAGSDGRVHALEVSNGSLRWKFETQNAVAAGVTYHNGKLFIASRDSNLYILNGSDGTLIRTIMIGDKVMATPSVQGDRVLVSSLNGVVSSFSVADGSLQWKFSAKSAVNTTPVIASDRVIVASLDRHVYVLSLSDGALLWKHDLESRIKTTPIVWKNSVIIAAENKNIYKFR